GIGVPQLNDYRLFLTKLAVAIAAQTEEVKRRQKLWETEHASWLALRQKQQALEVLRERHVAAEAVVEAKREQKQQDEFASRSGKAKPLQG
ncbi:MAG: flagellar export protein FliJ, partial [Betaproteobacteria bacterium]